MTPIIGVLALSACNNVNGKVDERSVNINTAVFVEEDDYYGNDGVIMVLLATHGLNCEEWVSASDDFEDDLNNLDFDDAIDEWEASVPEDFWVWDIKIRVDDVDDKNKGEWDGVDWDDPITDDDEAKVLARHWTEYPEEEDLLGDVWTGDDWYHSDEGVLNINGHTPGESIRGNFATMMVDEDGDTEGEVTIHFNAARCRDLKDYYI